MARINLLPWREQQRQERQREFMMSALMTAVLGVILVFLIGLVFDQRISYQNARNQRLQEEIGRLMVQIRRIEQLEQTRSRLLTRKQIIEELQASRSLTVEMLDQMAKSIPVGVTLDSINQQGMHLTLNGSSQSNARVSAYLQSLQENDLFLEPDLEVVQVDDTPESSVEPYDFSLQVKLRPTVNEDEALGYDPIDKGGSN